MKKPEKKLSLIELVALVIGSIIGGGIFNLMHDMAAGAGVGAIIIGFIITGIGMITLGFTFQNLNMKRSDLNAGIYSYAEAGFGKYMGFNSAWGYWLSALLGNVGYATLMMSALGFFFPIFGNGQNIWSVILASILLWFCFGLILRGVESASFINAVITIAKLIPIFLFILITIFAFKLNVFTENFWQTSSGSFELGTILSQVRSMMLVSVWVFIGIEGAVVFSGRAKKRSDVGKATILGLISVLLIYMLVVLLSFGIMNRYHLSHLSQPAMAQLLSSVVGKWGAVVVNIGLIVSVAGAWLSWTMFASQLPYEAAKQSTFPKIFGKENKNKAPVVSLLITSILTQIFILSYLITTQAYNFFYSIATSAILVPYAFSAFYQLKYSLQEDHGNSRIRNIVIGIIASIYAIWLIVAAGFKYILLTTVLFALDIPVYVYLQKKENKAKRIFGPVESILALILLGCAIWAIYELIIGNIAL